MASGMGEVYGATDWTTGQQFAWWMGFSRAWRELEANPRALDGLEDGCLEYFRVLAVSYFAKALRETKGLANRGYATPEKTEVWSVVFGWLYEKRADGRRNLDDILSRARMKAREKGVDGEEEIVLRILKNQFEMRIRDVVRAWARSHFGTEKERETTGSLDTKLSRRDGAGDGMSVGDTIADAGESFEEAELREVAVQLAESLFADLGVVQGEGKKRTDGSGLVVGWVNPEKQPDLGRVVTFFKKLGVSLAEPALAAHFEVKRWQRFHEHEKAIRQEIVRRVNEIDRGMLDRESQIMVGTRGFQHLRDLCDAWFFTEKRNEPLFGLGKGARVGR